MVFWAKRHFVIWTFLSVSEWVWVRTGFRLWRRFGRWLHQLDAWEHYSTLIGAFLSLLLWRSTEWPPPPPPLLLLFLSLPSHFRWQSLTLSCPFAPAFSRGFFWDFCVVWTRSCPPSLSSAPSRQTCRWVNGSRTAAAGTPAAYSATPSPSTTPSAPRPPLWWRRRSVSDVLVVCTLFSQSMSCERGRKSA